MNGVSPEQIIVSDETTFRTYVVLKLQAIEINCKSNCATASANNGWVRTAGKMILSSILTGAVAVFLALLTLHLR